MQFDHTRFEVYQLGLKLFEQCNCIAETLPRNRFMVADQLLRASLSVPFNIAEGAGEFSRAEKSRFYRMARRSAAEVAAILDAIEIAGLSPASAQIAQARQTAERIAAMLTGLIVSTSARAK